MNRTLKHYLELIRLPGLFTAQADILAAGLITGIYLPELLLLIIATSCFFSAGMALNDYFDYQEDFRERPFRPLPSGRISRSAALILGVSLLLAGVFAAALAGPRSFWIGLALAAAILLYDGGVKKLPVLGPAAMALCRYLNLLMGLSIAPFEGWGWIPLISWLYILGVTVLSGKETCGGRVPGTLSICCTAFAIMALAVYFFHLQGLVPHLILPVLAIGFAMIQSKRVLTLLDHHRPEDFQKVMKHLLLSIIVLNAILVTGFAPVYQGILVLVLLVPARLSVRLFKVT